MNRVHNDWLPVEAEAHQSWPPKKNKKETDKLTNRERQKKEKKQKKRKYIVIHKIAAEKYKKNY